MCNRINSSIYCCACGKVISPDSNFCMECGASILIQDQLILETLNKEIRTANAEPLSKKNIRRKCFIGITLFVLCAVLVVVALKTIPYKCFSIKDDDLFEILNEIGSYASQSSIKVDGFNSDVSVYRITCLEDTGLLVLSHSLSGHIRGIMVCFEDDVYSAAIISGIASELDFSFSSSQAMDSLLLSSNAYSSHEYTAVRKKLSSNLNGVFLAPNSCLEDSLNSFL